MSEAGVDYLLAFTELTQSEIGAGRPTEARYIANDTGSVIFPREGEPILLSAFGRSSALTGVRQEPREDWIKDVRSAFGPSDPVFASGPAIGRALAELGVGKRRVAVSGLRGGPYTMVRMPAGSVNYSTLEDVREAIPEAEIVDGTRIVGAARYIKSDEEVAYIRLSEQLAEHQVQVLTERARPGVTLADLYAELTACVQRAGFSVARQSLATAPWGEPWWMAGQAGDAPTVALEEGWLIKNELEPQVAGYSAAIAHPVVLGRPLAEQRELFELGREAFEVASSAMKPGVTWGEVWPQVAALGTSRYSVEFLMHGRGLGDDGVMYVPIGNHEDNPSNDDPIRENTVFVLKPFARRNEDPSSDWAIGRYLTWGDSVVVTPSGAQRLGQRPYELTAID